MSKELRMMLLDVKAQTLKQVMVKDELEEYYKLLDCDCIDIVERKIGEEYFDIICDDEALLKDSPILSAIKDNSWKVEPMLCGNLLICRTDGEGNETELSMDDCFDIQDRLVMVESKDGKQFKVLLMDY